jgi:hypothetical protein
MALPTRCPGRWARAGEGSFLLESKAVCIVRGKGYFWAMVGQSEFQTLTKEEQVEFVLEHGQYVHYRIKGWCMIQLYVVGASGPLKDAYFVELWYLYDLKTVGLIRTFTGTGCLDPFLQNIQLSLT